MSCVDLLHGNEREGMLGEVVGRFSRAVMAWMAGSSPAMTVMG
jgi:hypothetical protein